MLKFGRYSGLLAALAATGLMMGSISHAQTPSAAPAATTTAPGVAVTADQPAATSAAPEAPNPLLAVDGGPAVAIKADAGQPVDGWVDVQNQVTPTGKRAAWMHGFVLMPVITAISIFVLALLVWCVVRYRRAANPVASKTSHNTMIEVIWTLAPIVILLGIAIPSIGLLQAQFKPAPSNAITLKAVGNQWYWTYQYPDNGGFEITSNILKEKGETAEGERARTDADGPPLLATDNRVVLPVGVPIRLLTTSADVIHAWAIPAFWIKLDAIPGRINETNFTIQKPGVYFGQCSELCGARHGYMPITVVAVEKPVFDQWVVAKGGTVKGAAPAAEAPAAMPAAAAAPAAAPVAPATDK
ncbi:MAG: cytochrome c oxidase subunit II [Sphingomonas sp.]|uniref:cytochrome c oxidase subunit II n=1 Tax=Sphingomonas sp. TaxID=28214 RepID=UPI0017966A6B|nr:cytochrome c oxidase subunit II [Sphingomonas sp.]